MNLKIPGRFTNIIFDLGGVILNIDYALTEKAFASKGINDFKALFSKASQSGLFDLLETGKISPVQFRNKLREITGSDIDDKIIDEAWNSMLLDLPLYRIEILKKVSEKYRIFLLSNTNQIHVQAFTSYLDIEFGKDLFPKIFEKVYYSHEMGRRKPDAATFKFVLEDNNLSAEETLFIDDSIQHVEGAEAVGIHAIHLRNGMDIRDLFI